MRAYQSWPDLPVTNTGDSLRAVGTLLAFTDAAWTICDLLYYDNRLHLLGSHSQGFCDITALATGGGVTTDLSVSPPVSVTPVTFS